MAQSTRKMWSDALRRALRDRAPALVKSLRDDRTGIARLTPARRSAARLSLGKIMTHKKMEEAVGPVRPVIKRPKTLKRKPSKKTAGKK